MIKVKSNGVKTTDSSVKCPVRLQIAIEHSINGIIVLKICQAATPSSLSMSGLIFISMRLRTLGDRVEVAELVKGLSSVC